MTTRSVDMYELQIPVEAIRNLSNEDRFSYYLLGHIFNELMSLQKLIGFALPKHEDTRRQRSRPEHAQAMFLFRLASGKIWEAIKTIRESKQLAMTLRNVVLPRMTNGVDRLKTLNAVINSAPWLSSMRNGLGFHFPTFDHWKNQTVPDESWVDDYVFLGSQSGNTFFDASDVMAQHWMFGQFGASNILEAIDPLINQMIDLLREMNTFLEDVLTVFIGDVILKGSGERKYIGKVLSPQHDQVSIPFWTAMPKQKE